MVALFDKDTGKKLWEKAKSGAGSAMDFTKKTGCRKCNSAWRMS